MGFSFGFGVGFSLAEKGCFFCWVEARYFLPPSLDVRMCVRAPVLSLGFCFVGLGFGWFVGWGGQLFPAALLSRGNRPKMSKFVIN